MKREEEEDEWGVKLGQDKISRCWPHQQMDIGGEAVNNRQEVHTHFLYNM